MNIPVRHSAPSFPFPVSRRATDSRKSFRWWYDAIIDWMLANPGKTQVECAKHFGKAPNTIHMIVTSDLFRARFAQRRAEVNAELRDQIVDKTARVASKALDVIHERLVDNPASVPLSLANDIMGKTLDRLGFGQPAISPHQQVNVQVNVPVSRDVLDAARSDIRQIEQTKLQEDK